MTKSRERVHYFLVNVPDEAWQFLVLRGKQCMMEDQQTTQSHHMLPSVHFTRFNCKKRKDGEGEIKKSELMKEAREKTKRREDNNEKWKDPCNT